MLMVKQIELDWSQGIKIDNDFFPEDKLGRVKYATFLTKLLSSQGFDEMRDDGNQKKNYVLNLNAEWGAGKTYFLKRWSEDIKEYYPVVYIDAWKKDYSDDPLMTVISSIIEQLRKQAGKEKSLTEFKAPRKLIGLLKAAAPGVTRGLFKRYVGIDPLEVMNADEDENLGNIKDANGDEITDENGKPIDMSFAASEAVKYLIDEHEAKSVAIESLKASVFEWVEAVVKLKKKKLPAFIFIDELDRCRPNYAVEMLEIIKHIFDIDGVVFVVATDTEQLQHAVKAIYGEGFDAKMYLGRFFNSRYSLKAPNLESFLEVHSDANKLSGEYLEELNIKILPFNRDAKVTLKNISMILDSFNISARTAIQITDRIVATISNMPRGSRIDILMLTALLCFKEKDHKLFEEIISGKFEKFSPDRVGNKTIFLDAFLETYLPESFHNRLFDMNFDPQKFSPDMHYPTISNEPNAYTEGCYQIPLIDYFQKVFCEHFSSTTENSYSVDLLDDTGTSNSPLIEIKESLSEEYNSNRYTQNSNMIGNSALLWMQYLYISEKFESIGIDEYKDFVELASPLDWMGKSELDETE
jgi:hypothetical protein